VQVVAGNQVVSIKGVVRSRPRRPCCDGWKPQGKNAIDSFWPGRTIFTVYTLGPPTNSLSIGIRNHVLRDSGKY
jgi:hypothetical protein